MGLIFECRNLIFTPNPVNGLCHFTGQLFVMCLRSEQEQSMWRPEIEYDRCSYFAANLSALCKSEIIMFPESVQASRFQDVSEASIYENRSHLQNIDHSPATPDRFTGLP